MAFLVRVFICIFCAGLVLYSYIHQQNMLTELRFEIPILEKQVRKLHEENNRLEYEVDRFESPIHLMELLREPEFAHLVHPELREVIILPKGQREWGDEKK